MSSGCGFEQSNNGLWSTRLDTPVPAAGPIHAEQYTPSLRAANLRCRENNALQWCPLCAWVRALSRSANKAHHDQIRYEISGRYTGNPTSWRFEKGGDVKSNHAPNSSTRRETHRIAAHTADRLAAHARALSDRSGILLGMRLGRRTAGMFSGIDIRRGTVVAWPSR
jgi:hypothetical protein